MLPSTIEIRLTWLLFNFLCNANMGEKEAEDIVRAERAVKSRSGAWQSPIPAIFYVIFVYFTRQHKPCRKCVENISERERERESEFWSEHKWRYSHTNDEVHWENLKYCARISIFGWIQFSHKNFRLFSQAHRAQLTQIKLQKLAPVKVSQFLIHFNLSSLFMTLQTNISFLLLLHKKQKKREKTFQLQWSVQLQISLQQLNQLTYMSSRLMSSLERTHSIL